MTREDAIEILKGIQDNLEETRFLERCAIDMGIEALQEPKKGHWIVTSDGYGDNAYICECSECKDTVWVYKDADRKWKYCPSCGADMRERR